MLSNADSEFTKLRDAQRINLKTAITPSVDKATPSLEAAQAS